MSITSFGIKAQCPKTSALPGTFCALNQAGRGGAAGRRLGDLLMDGHPTAARSRRSTGHWHGASNMPESPLSARQLREDHPALLPVQVQEVLHERWRCETVARPARSQ